MSRRACACGEQRTTTGWDVGLGAVDAQVESLPYPAVAARRTDAAGSTEGAHR